VGESLIKFLAGAGFSLVIDEFLSDANILSLGLLMWLAM